MSIENSLKGPEEMKDGNFRANELRQMVEEMMTNRGAFHAAFSGSRKNGEAVRPPSPLRGKERAEVLRSLKFRELVIPRSVESMDHALRPIADLYKGNLASDEAFIALERGDNSEFMRIVGDGKMMHRWVPTPREQALYEKKHKEEGMDFKCVRDQVRDDLLERSESPGSYRMFLLENAQGEEVASMSCRLPPLHGSPEELAEYAEYMRSLLFCDDIQLENHWRKRLSKWMPSVMEWDTVNVRPGYDGAGVLIFAKVMAAIENQYGDQTPEMIFHYRFEGANIAEVHERQGDGYMVKEVTTDGTESYEVAANNRSQRYAMKLGSTNCGYKMAEKEPIIREVDGGERILVITPKWRYASGLWRRVMRGCLMPTLHEMGLSPEELGFQQSAPKELLSQ